LPRFLESVRARVSGHRYGAFVLSRALEDQKFLFPHHELQDRIHDALEQLFAAAFHVLLAAIAAAIPFNLSVRDAGKQFVPDESREALSSAGRALS